MSAPDAVDGSSTGIANDRSWHKTDVLAGELLCPLLGAKADIGIASHNVCS